MKVIAKKKKVLKLALERKIFLAYFVSRLEIFLFTMVHKAP